MNNPDRPEPNPEDLERLIREFMQSGKFDPAELAKTAGLPIDPAQLSILLNSLTQAVAAGDGAVNWQMAQQQAISIAREGESALTDSEQKALEDAFQISRLWLSEVTEKTCSANSKSYSRGTWVQDAVPLFRQLSEPIATSMGKALSENLTSLLPESMNVANSAAELIKNAGSAIFALQLGQAIGKMSQQAITAGEIGIPLSDRPGIISQNLKTYATDLEVPISELTIYFALRELAISALYASSPWLRDQVTAQIREYAADLKVDVEQIKNLSESYDPENPTEFTFAIEQGALISPRTEEQQIALDRIEFTLAIIEGWVECVCLEAGKRLTKVAAISEAIRRRRVTGSAAEKTFETLLGLELRPKLAREALGMWQLLTSRLGPEQRDSLWSHPDQLPSREELNDPESLIARVQSGGDDFDKALRDFLA